MGLLINRNYHEDDFLYNTSVLSAMAGYRRVETVVFGDSPVFIYKLKRWTLKIKAYIPSGDKSIAEQVFALAKEKRSPSLEIITNTENESIASLEKRTKRSCRATYLIDLKKDNAALFSNIANSRRGHIKSAENKGVTVRRDMDEDIFNAWWAIYTDTVNRGMFVSEDKKYVWELLNCKACELFTAWKDGRMLAGAVVSVNNYPFCYIAGSSKENPELNASSLIQWRIIEHYKSKGYDIYDMGGASLKAGHGPAEFKKSFGGELRKTVHYKITLDPLFAGALGALRHIYYFGLKRSAF